MKRGFGAKGQSIATALEDCSIQWKQIPRTAGPAAGIESGKETNSGKPFDEETNGHEALSQRQSSREDSASNFMEASTSMMSVVSAESGYSMDEMTDDTSFVDLGIDSIMAIAILGKLRQVGLDLPLGLFLQNETVGDLKKDLRQALERG